MNRCELNENWRRKKEPTGTQIPQSPGFPGLRKIGLALSYYLAYFNKRKLEINQSVHSYLHLSVE